MRIARVALLFALTSAAAFAAGWPNSSNALARLTAEE